MQSILRIKQRRSISRVVVESITAAREMLRCALHDGLISLHDVLISLHDVLISLQDVLNSFMINTNCFRLI